MNNIFIFGQTLSQKKLQPKLLKKSFKKLIFSKSLTWSKKGNIFSSKKNPQGYLQNAVTKFDSMIETKKSNQLKIKTNPTKLKIDLPIKKIKKGWPYLSCFSLIFNKPNNHIQSCGEHVIHDIYSENSNFVVNYYMNSSLKFNINSHSLNKLLGKKTVLDKRNQNCKLSKNLTQIKKPCLLLIQFTKEFSLYALKDNVKKFQLTYLKNSQLDFFKRSQYLKKFVQLKYYLINTLFNKLNSQFSMIGNKPQVEAWISRLEPTVFILNPTLFNTKIKQTKHTVINNCTSIKSRSLAHFSFVIRPNLIFSKIEKEFISKNVFNRLYQFGIAEPLESDAFFSKQNHTLKQLYRPKFNLLIPTYSPVVKNFFLSTHNGEIFNVSSAKNSEKHLEHKLETKPKIRSSPGATVLTSRNCFIFSLKNFENQCQIGDEIYRGQNIGNQSTPIRTGQIVYMTKNMVKCQIVDQFIMSTNSKFFCYNNQLILKNTRLYKDFYPGLQMGDIVQGIPKIEEFFEARKSKKGVYFEGNVHNRLVERFKFYHEKCGYPLPIADRRSITDIQKYIIGSIFKLYNSQGINIADKHLELIVRQMTSKVKVNHYLYSSWTLETALLYAHPINNEYYSRYVLEDIYRIRHKRFIKNSIVFRYVIKYEPIILGITEASLESFGFISAASFQETTKVITQSSILQKMDYLKGLKENVVLGHLIPAGTALKTRLKHRRRQSTFMAKNFRKKLSKLLIYSRKLDVQLNYKSAPYSCRHAYLKSHKYTNPILYLFLYIYCVYDYPLAMEIKFVGNKN